MHSILIILSLLLLSSCSSTKDYFTTNSQKNKKDAPYILLISIDGYRWDYTELYKPEFLTRFKSDGSSIESLIPSFPTKTFPNHLSLVTGRYPMNHGIVGNQFYAPDLGSSYSLRDSNAVTNSDFYKAKPFWTLAEEQGLKSATYFWPGSEAKFNSILPSYYLKYNHGTSHQKRIDTIVEWFSMKEEIRPHFATLYFHDVDSAGHKFGPNSEQTKQAVHKVDNSIKQLVTKLEKLKLPLNIIIVSDHGMAELSKKNVELIGKTESTKKLISTFKTVGKGPLVHFYRKDEKQKNISQTVRKINNEADHFKCYENKKTPKKLNFNTNSRIGDFVCLANRDWSISTETSSIPKGNHGWSQFEGKDMHSILYAKGPAFKKGHVCESFRNIDLYPLMAKILNLKIEHKIDGDLKISSQILK
ncbi:ectonucleotide pyrophosphatase/phosphodiesterase [Halobacteriovorax sp. HLS]|uniref:alkaline phosphatase family protein n=1 Tax=Halobacteriovorax sp. HLS TaxID=2234000 RepID=UPI000FDA7E5E|nr:ectonucleotide pyrophosphatase/phosphodiesterase [Halobacteriovorax sp. HLS]